MRRLWDKISLFGALWGVSYIAGSVMCIAAVAQLWGPNWAGSLASFLIIGGTIIFESRARQSGQRQINAHLNDLQSRQKFMGREISRVRSDIDGLKDDMVQAAMNLARESRRSEVALSAHQGQPATQSTVQSAGMSDAGGEAEEQSETSESSPSKAATGAAHNGPSPQVGGSHSGLIEVMQKSLMRMGMKSQPRPQGAFIPMQRAANEDQTPEAEADSQADSQGDRDSALRAPSRANAHPHPHQSRAQKYREILMSSPMDKSSRGADSPGLAIPEYSPAVLSELIFHAVMNDKIEIFAQPIVRLPSRKICYLELFARIRAKAGIYLPAQTYRPLAQQDSQLETLDLLLLLHTIDTIRADARRNQSIGYFINIYSGTLKHTDFINNLLEFIRARRDLLPLLVFELQYEDFNTLTPSFLKIMDGLRQLGCQFSLDNITNLNINASQLRSLGVSFIKMNGEHLIELCSTPYGEIELARMKAKLDECGVRLIVEKLETEQAVVNLLDFEIDYGEGYLFGKPDLEVAYRRHM